MTEALPPSSRARPPGSALASSRPHVRVTNLPSQPGSGALASSRTRLLPRGSRGPCLAGSTRDSEPTCARRPRVPLPTSPTRGRLVAPRAPPRRFASASFSPHGRPSGTAPGALVGGGHLCRRPPRGCAHPSRSTHGQCCASATHPRIHASAHPRIYPSTTRPESPIAADSELRCCSAAADQRARHDRRGTARSALHTTRGPSTPNRTSRALPSYTYAPPPWQLWQAWGGGGGELAVNGRS